MKSEERHELEKNILADRIGTGIEAARPVLPMLLGGIAIAVVAAIGWAVYSASVQSRSALAWTDYYFNLATSNQPDSYYTLLSDVSARDADAFLDVAERFPSSSAAGWANQSAGARFLEQGIEALYRNRAEGETLLNQAIESFGAAAESREPALQVRAQFGLGRAYEALSKLDDAANAYNQVIEATSLPELAEDAKRRLAFVTSQEGKQFYAWFATLDPKPDAPIRLPGDLSVPPTNPADMSFDPLDLGLGNSFPVPAENRVPAPAGSDSDAPPSGVLDPSSITLPPTTTEPATTSEPPGEGASGLELTPPTSGDSTAPANVEAPSGDAAGTEPPATPDDPAPSSGN